MSRPEKNGREDRMIQCGCWSLATFEMSAGYGSGKRADSVGYVTQISFRIFMFLV